MPSLKSNRSIDVKLQRLYTLLDTIAPLAQAIAEKSGYDNAHVVVLNHAPLTLKYEVFLTGKAAYVASREEYIEDRVKTVQMYLDYEPYMKMHFDRIVEAPRNW